MAAAAKKAFTKLTAAFYASPQWTLRHFKTNLQEGMDKESWKMMLPGVRSSAQVTELKESMKVMDAMTPEELDGAVKVEGLRLTRLSKESGRDVPFVVDVLMRYEQTVLLHKWLRRNQALGLPEPETLEEATFAMSRDPSSRPPKDSRANRPMRTMQRRMARRGF